MRFAKVNIDRKLNTIDSVPATDQSSFFCKSYTPSHFLLATYDALKSCELQRVIIVVLLALITSINRGVTDALVHVL